MSQKIFEVYMDDEGHISLVGNGLSYNQLSTILKRIQEEISMQSLPRHALDVISEIKKKL